MAINRNVVRPKQVMPQPPIDIGAGNGPPRDKTMPQVQQPRGGRPFPPANTSGPPRPIDRFTIDPPRQPGGGMAQARPGPVMGGGPFTGGGPAPMGGGPAPMGAFPRAPAPMGGAPNPMTMKKGGRVKAYAKGGTVFSSSKASSASSRGDGIAQRGKTKGRMC